MEQIDVAYTKKLKIKDLSLYRLLLGLGAIAFVVTSCRRPSVADNTAQMTSTSANPETE